MKKISTILAVLCAVILLAPSASRAQSIAINSVSATTFCAGDPVSVTFTATGTWGRKLIKVVDTTIITADSNVKIDTTIVKDTSGKYDTTITKSKVQYDTTFLPSDSIYSTNAFTIQLSNPSGSFSNGFTDLGSLIDTAPGTFTITSSFPSGVGSHFRLRVIGAYPYIESADNGTDITIEPVIGGPSATLFFTPADPFKIPAIPPGGVVGQPTLLQITTGSGKDSLVCDFGADASQATTTHVGGFKQSVTYSSAGIKIVTIQASRTNGCPATAQSADTFRIYDCTPPTIPHNAIIIDSESAKNNSVPFYLDPKDPHSYWLNPGVNWSGGEGVTNDTFYCEAGSTISDYGQGGVVIYLKKGASALTWGGDMMGNPSVVIYAQGASIQNDSMPDVMEIPCDELSFDYSAAPPNSIMHINENESVAPAVTLGQIALSPNPTNGIVAVQGVPVSAQVQVMNVLGVAVQEMARTTEANFTLDLSSLAAGTYYVRITSGNGVTTKKVVKE